MVDKKVCRTYSLCPIGVCGGNDKRLLFFCHVLLLG